MKKALKVIGITCGVFIVGVILVLVVISVGVIHFAKSLPTTQPTAVLIIGQTFWINAILPVKPLPAGMVVTSAEIQNKPGNLYDDPSITYTASVPDGTKVSLSGVRGDWCYVKGIYNPMRDFSVDDSESPLPTLDWRTEFEGWVECSRLLDYEPTPYPTPNRTPVAP
jgi:hypothetical protein